nr:hypothetical protein [Tanacetum cinerariifolium]
MFTSSTATATTTTTSTATSTFITNLLPAVPALKISQIASVRKDGHAPSPKLSHLRSANHTPNVVAVVAPVSLKQLCNRKWIPQEPKYSASVLKAGLVLYPKPMALKLVKPTLSVAKVAFA